MRRPNLGRPSCDALMPNGMRCTNPAGKGTEREEGPCWAHISKEQSLELAERTKHAVGRRVAPFGSKGSADPIQELVDLIRRTSGFVNWIEGELQDLDYNVHEVPTAAQQYWLDRYAKERDLLFKFSKGAIDAGVSVYKVKMAKEQSVQMADAVREILAQLELTPEQKRRAPKLVTDILRSIASDNLNHLTSGDSGLIEKIKEVKERDE